MGEQPTRIGKYDLVEFLGGGMSHVYRARDPVLGRTVAVKILTEVGSEDPEVTARFLQEARIASNFRHENILTVYDYGADDQHRPYMVMEFLQGEDLRTAIASNHTGDLNNKLRIAIQLARALEYVHEQKVVHRDVKPENINIAPDGTVKLMDFGISKIADLTVTRAGLTLGSPAYMAPEQVLGQEISPLTDVYAFGVLLFELITGVKRYQGDTVERIFYRILKEPLDPAPLRSAGAPEPLCALVVRCTEKDPQRRIQSFSLIVADLSTLLNQGPRVASSPARFPSWLVPAVAAAICLVAGLLVWLGPLRWPWLLALEGVLVAAAFAMLSLRPKHHSAQAAPGGPARPDEAEKHRDTNRVATQQAAAPVQIPGRPMPAGSLPPSLPGEFTGLFQAPAFGQVPSAAPAPATQPAIQPELLPNSLSSLSGSPGEFTRFFHTTPELAPPGHVPPPLRAPPNDQEPGAFTQMFRVEKDAQQPGKPVSDATIIPDVALTITACSDVAFAGRRFEIHRFPFRIGIASSNDLVLPFDRAISRSHVEVQFVNGGFAILDLGSANGTYLNGKRLQARPEPLLFGARILLGSNTQLTFVANDLQELPDLTGELIAGRYRLTARVFTSAKSAAYRATDAKLQDRPVLVKLLSPRLAQQPGYREQFEDEAKIASRLRHSHISRILEYGETALGETAKTLYLTMEFLDGGSLAQRLASDQRFELDRIASWLEKLASSLDYAHEEGVIHGGIKPSSIIFDSRDNPYLTDFAIAVAGGDQSRRTLIGSPAFLAPEQWEGNDLSPATDQYSLAAVLYLVITGSHPYEGQEHPEMRKRNLQRGPVAAHEMAQNNRYQPVPAAVSAVLQRAMATDRSFRFLTASEFARAFRNALLVQVVASPKKPYVFISYHRATGSPWALLFKNELEREHGCEVFIDTEQNDRAGQFPAKLERHIERSDVFVCLLGKGALESKWVNREIELALQWHKPMVPVFQESFRFPGDLSAVAPHVRELLLFDGVKLLDRQNLYVSSAIKSLSEAIRHSLPKT